MPSAIANICYCIRIKKPPSNEGGLRINFLKLVTHFA
jgi:hypothetical protein